MVRAMMSVVTMKREERVVMSDADDEDLSQKSNSRLKAILVCGAVAEWSSFASWRDC